MTVTDNLLVFLDTETTGLDPDKHDVWELTYAIEDEAPVTRILVHSIKAADPKALELNGYLRVFPGGARSDGPMVDLEVREVLDGSTIVCANPTFDRMFLRARWGLEPWHYRSIDIESMALVVFGWDRPRGLKSIAEELIKRKHDVPMPDHTSRGDVIAMRAAFHALKAENQKYKIY
jgi:oligoribonuclease (3'-5' exoribonuclease)